MAYHAARVFTRDQLLDAVRTAGSFVTQRSVDVYIRRLLEKIEPDPDHPSYLKQYVELATTLIFRGEQGYSPGSRRLTSCRTLRPSTR